MLAERLGEILDQIGGGDVDGLQIPLVRHGNRSGLCGPAGVLAGVDAEIRADNSTMVVGVRRERDRFSLRSPLSDIPALDPALPRLGAELDPHPVTEPSVFMGKPPLFSFDDRRQCVGRDLDQHRVGIVAVGVAEYLHFGAPLVGHKPDLFASVPDDSRLGKVPELDGHPPRSILGDVVPAAVRGENRSPEGLGCLRRPDGEHHCRIRVLAAVDLSHRVLQRAPELLLGKGAVDVDAGRSLDEPDVPVPRNIPDHGKAHGGRLLPGTARVAGGRSTRGGGRLRMARSIARSNGSKGQERAEDSKDAVVGNFGPFVGATDEEGVLDHRL